MLTKHPKALTEGQDRGQTMAREIGRELREARQARGEELALISAFLRIRPDYLAALEEGEFSRISAWVYLVGFLRSYGNYLGLDGNGLVARLSPPVGNRSPVLLVRNHPELVAIAHRRPSGGALLLLLFGIGGWGVYYAATAVIWNVPGQSAIPPVGTISVPAGAPPQITEASTGVSSPQPLRADDLDATPPDLGDFTIVGRGEPERGTTRPILEPMRSELLIPLAAPEQTHGSPALPDPAATADARQGPSNGPPTSVAVLGDDGTGATQSSHRPGEMPAVTGSISGGGRPDNRGGETAPIRPVAAGKLSPSAVDTLVSISSPVSTSTVGQFAVQVALVRNSADVRMEWRRLAKLYPSLAGLALQAPRVVEIVGKGTFYRILGGAFTTRAEARTVCDQLRSDGGECSVVAL